MTDEVSIGDLARRTGVGIETIRYYERIRLMPQVRRSSGGRRKYRDDDVKTLAFIKKARDLNFRLEDIRALLALRGPDQECSDVKKIAQRHLEQVRAELRRTAEVERILAEAVTDCPGGKTAACTVLKILESA